MPAGRNVTLCGLYLDFAALRDCVEGVKSTGVCAVDISLVLPDGSLMSAAPIPKDRQRLEAAIHSRGLGCGQARTPRVTPVAGALTRTLLTMGVPVYDSERLESKIRNGGILLSIRCDDSVAEQVQNVLIQTGAHDISLGRDTKEFERCSIPRKAPYAAVSTSGWQQSSAHA
jgi:hypothetical protein